MPSKKIRRHFALREKKGGNEQTKGLEGDAVVKNEQKTA